MPDWSEVTSLFSVVFGILDALGVLTVLGFVVTGILIIGLTFRVIDSIGGRGS